ncbi:MAG: hypothetical protein IT444_11745 [Phycisphaeraceae bacterium]|nr:hypothetical protein [Phycisphaeraceae bacterium]
MPSNPSPAPLQLSRRLIGIILLVTLVAGVLAYTGRVWLAKYRLAKYEPLLQSEDPEVSLRAALEISQIDPYHRQARLVEARALLDKGLHHQARLVLEALDRDGSYDAASLQAKAFVTEADDIVQRTPAPLIASVRPDVESLLAYATQRRETFALKHPGDPALAMMEATERDVRSALMFRILHSPEMIEASLPQPSGSVELMQRQMAASDTTVNRLSRSMRRQMPNDPQPRYMLIRAAWRAGDRDTATAEAKDLAELPKLSRHVAGAVADTLLSLERSYGLPVTDDEVNCAEKLINHSSLVGADSLRLDIAQVRLRLARGNAPAAEELVRRLLEKHPSHPTLVSLLSTAMLNRGLVDEAIAAIKPLAEETQFPEVMGAYGIALAAKGDKNQSELWLQQSLKRDNDNLVFRLALIDSLISGGPSTLAEQDIMTAAALSPNHPRVRAYRIALLVDKVDRRGLSTLLSNQGAKLATPTHVALAAAMALDDVMWLDGRLDRPSLVRDPFIDVVDAWRRAEGGVRMRVSWTVVRAMRVSLEPDPLTLREARRPSYTRSEPAPTTGRASLRENRFVPPLLAQARDMLTLAAQRWPDANELHEQESRLALLSDESPSDVELPRYSMVRLWSDLCFARRNRNVGAVNLALRDLLKRHPWNDAAAMMVIADAMADVDQARMRDVIELVREMNAGLSTLCRARINLALNDAAHAAADARSLIDQEAADSEMRLIAAEFAARAALEMGNPDVAAAAFQALAVTNPDRSLEMRLLGTEALKAGKADRKLMSAMTEIIKSEAMENAPLWLVDRVLSTARMSLSPAIMLPAVSYLNTKRPSDPLVLIYLAELQLDSGNLDAAKETRDQLQRLNVTGARFDALVERIEAAAKSTPPQVGIIDPAIPDGAIVE